LSRVDECLDGNQVLVVGIEHVDALTARIRALFLHSLFSDEGNGLLIRKLGIIEAWQMRVYRAVLKIGYLVARNVAVEVTEMM